MSEKKTMIDQFKAFTEPKGKIKVNKAKGPPDLKDLRQTVNSWNKENRKP
jgi:hypothetical protein